MPNLTQNQYRERMLRMREDQFEQRQAQGESHFEDRDAEAQQRADLAERKFALDKQHAQVQTARERVKLGDDQLKAAVEKKALDQMTFAQDYLARLRPNNLHASEALAWLHHLAPLAFAKTNSNVNSGLLSSEEAFIKECTASHAAQRQTAKELGIDLYDTNAGYNKETGEMDWTKAYAFAKSRNEQTIRDAGLITTRVGLSGIPEGGRNIPADTMRVADHRAALKNNTDAKITQLEKSIASATQRHAPWEAKLAEAQSIIDNPKMRGTPQQIAAEALKKGAVAAMAPLKQTIAEQQSQLAELREVKTTQPAQPLVTASPNAAIPMDSTTAVTTTSEAKPTSWTNQLLH